MSTPHRFYIEVQSYLRSRLEANNPPSTSEIQRSVFGIAYDPDSQYQRIRIYNRIEDGRRNALLLWEQYCQSSQYEQDFQQLLFYGGSELPDEERDDYYDFYAKLLQGQFREETEGITDFLNDYKIVARMWKNKVEEYSRELNNLVISTKGRGAVWILPSWWRWAIRETDLYLRSVRILQMQFRRGITTKLLTASGEPLEKAIGYAKGIEGLLEDGDSWICPECTFHNHGTSNFCSNCGHEKPNNQ